MIFGARQDGLSISGTADMMEIRCEVNEKGSAQQLNVLIQYGRQLRDDTDSRENGAPNVTDLFSWSECLSECLCYETHKLFAKPCITVMPCPRKTPTN